MLTQAIRRVAVDREGGNIEMSNWTTHKSNSVFENSRALSETEDQHETVTSLVDFLVRLHVQNRSSKVDGDKNVGTLQKPEEAILNQGSADIAKFPLNCGGGKFVGPVEYLSSGIFGMAAKLHRKIDNAIVVAKLDIAPEGQPQLLPYECDIMKFLEKHNVDGALRCESRCEGQYNGENVDVIITSPFLANAKSSILSITSIFSDNKEAWRPAAVSTLEIGFAMLANGVCNVDQNHNILYSADGAALFIDLGLAVHVKKDLSLGPLPGGLERAVCNNGGCNDGKLTPESLITKFLEVLWGKVDSILEREDVQSLWQRCWEAAGTKGTAWHKLADEIYSQTMYFVLSVDDFSKLKKLLSDVKKNPNRAFCQSALNFAVTKPKRSVTPQVIESLLDACGLQVWLAFPIIERSGRYDYFQYLREQSSEKDYDIAFALGVSVSDLASTLKQKVKETSG